MSIQYDAAAKLDSKLDMMHILRSHAKPCEGGRGGAGAGSKAPTLIQTQNNALL